MTTTLNAANTNRLMPLVEYLCQHGWKPTRMPNGGRLAANRQKVLFTAGTSALALRFSFYSVGGSSRGRDHERRIQITTTYGNTFKPSNVFDDLVIGCERNQSTFVGVDPRRLSYGGTTSNASSFFSASGLEWTSPEHMLVMPYPSQLFGGTEYHAFFTVERFAEYIFNSVTIHAGAYTGNGDFSGTPSTRSHPLQVAETDATGDVLELTYASTPRVKRLPTDTVVTQFELNDPIAGGRTISAAEYAIIVKRREENGLLGEQFVLDYEKRRLTQARRRDLANNIQWISRESVGEGYDILSYENNGQDRHIEVKATAGTGMTFDMSENEWSTAQSLQNSYYLYRVFDVRSNSPHLRTFRDPCQLEQSGSISKIASGWRVTLT